jgi:hypothetical protein
MQPEPDFTKPRLGSSAHGWSRHSLRVFTAFNPTRRNSSLLRVLENSSPFYIHPAKLQTQQGSRHSIGKTEEEPEHKNGLPVSGLRSRKKKATCGTHERRPRGRADAMETGKPELALPIPQSLPPGTRRVSNCLSRTRAGSHAHAHARAPTTISSGTAAGRLPFDAGAHERTRRRKPTALYRHSFLKFQTMC